MFAMWSVSRSRSSSISLLDTHTVVNEPMVVFKHQLTNVGRRPYAGMRVAKEEGERPTPPLQGSSGD